ncbi:hypothetical protein B0T24DRAFT_673674 [Lasiosphaeria ovina]|uniref:Mid2 domain-containing protein n=1 Tax=Lasiosphaeria ovina TaxID=92902 RepID=A0AAE0NLT9_9PEZI|nr:hypothetical protein B0T24DRAFT_673674 [Lasiosphaeria ovina]
MPRSHSSPCAVSVLLLLLAASAHRALAVPYPKGQPARRQDGGYQLHTTTWTLTETFTSTYSSFIPAPTGPVAGGGGPDCVPVAGSGQIACGPVCCTNQQYCGWRGQCLDNIPGPGGGGVVPTVITTGGQVITTQYSAPFRVTSGVLTGTAASATTTNTAAVTPGGTASSLSPGAIAGIVIGTLAGIALLLLICACCVVRGLWHGIMALLGLGPKKKKTETVVEEERYTRRGSTHSHRDTHGGWFGGGGRPSTVASRKEKKKSSGLGLLGIGAAIGTILLLLGLRKDKKKKPTRKTRSDVSSSYWSDSYTADSPSELSE